MIAPGIARFAPGLRPCLDTLPASHAPRVASAQESGVLSLIYRARARAILWGLVAKARPRVPRDAHPSKEKRPVIWPDFGLK